MENKLSFFVPINKLDEEQRMVYGIATCSKLDNQNEIVDYSATKEALSDYSQWRNIREMHKPSAVGVAPLLELRDNSQELYIGAKIVDDQAWIKCKEGVYKGFSIGGEVLDRKVELDKASGKTFNRVTKYMLNEISIVDRPANPICRFQTVKRDTSIEIVTITEDPLKAESVRVMEKAITLSKRILSKEELERLPDESFGLIKIVSDGDKLVKHRLYPMPDRVHAINMIRKMVGADELTPENKERVHQTALLVLGKKHNETECPYCINNKLKGGVEVTKQIMKEVAFEEPKKKDVIAAEEKPAEKQGILPEVKAPEAVAEKPAEEQKPHIVVDEDAGADAVPDPTNEKLDRIITLLESLTGEEEEEQLSDYDESVEEKPVAEEDMADGEEEIKVEEEEEDEEPVKVDAKVAEEEVIEEEEDEACKASKAKTVKKVIKVGLLSKLKAVIEPLAKENKELKARLEKLEKQPLPRKEAKVGDKPVKVEKYQEVKLEKRESTFSEELTKDIEKAQTLRKSSKALTSDEDAFCKRVAERMLEEKLSK